MQQLINKRRALLRDKFKTFQLEVSRPLHKSICDLFSLYSNAMSWFFFEEQDIEREGMNNWRSHIDLASVKAHQIYLGLLKQGITVPYDERLKENRIEDCGYGPQYLDFHKHIHAIEDLLNFCVIGTADRKNIKRLEKEYAST